MRSFASVVIFAPGYTIDQITRFLLAILAECATNRNLAHLPDQEKHFGGASVFLKPQLSFGGSRPILA
jgi:hypothetical protein